MTRRHIGNCGLFLLLAISVPVQPEKVWAQPTRNIPFLSYRTEISPGSPEQDALFVSKVVPHLARIFYGNLTGDGLAYETIDVFIDRHFVRKKDGSFAFDASGNPVVEADIQLRVQGDRFYSATLAFLKWRHAFEKKWIHDASPENIPLERTPLQRIFEDPRLSEKEKIGQTLVFYQVQTQGGRAPREKMPDPEYWPVSPVFDVDEVGVQVQFNLRGGMVTVLHADSNRVWQLPFPATGSCDRWLRIYEREAKSKGLEKAAVFMQEEVKNW